MMMNSGIDRVVVFFETLSRESVNRMAEVYTEDCYFKDPFNEVRGLAHTQRIFLHMYEVLNDPRFVITGRVEQGSECFLTWDFLFTMKRLVKSEQCIRGASHLKLAADGRIAYHRDYWDAAEELYEKLPVLGSVMRRLKANNRVN
jgi:limonene-1,2-epoxide hydrolase